MRSLFFCSSLKKNQKDSVDFWHRKKLWKSELRYFWPSKLKRTKGLEFFHTHRLGAEAKLIHPWTQLKVRLSQNEYRISANSFRRNYSFLKVENVEIFIWFPHYGNFLLHKLNSCRGNYWRGETIHGNTVYISRWTLRKH